MEKFSSLLPPDIDRQLDGLLARWADTQRLSATRAEAIRRTIQTTSVELGYEWYRGFMDQMNKALRRAQMAAREQTSRPVWPVQGTHSWTPFVPANNANYRPYLRL